MGFSYNQQLFNEREKRGLTLRKAAKEIGITAFGLFMYENGYARPKGKSLEKIEKFYEFKVDYSNYQEYPDTTKVSDKKRKSRKNKLIVAGSLALVSLATMITGVSLFSSSTKGVESHFGEVYDQAREKAIEQGLIARDIITDLDYYYLKDSFTIMSFYKTNSFLYFNDSIYNGNIQYVEGEFKYLGMGRYNYTFGGELSRSSYMCTFSFGSSKASMFFAGEVLYENKPIEKFEKFTVYAQGEQYPVTEELGVKLFNAQVGEAMFSFTKILKDALGYDVDFYNDFLSAREEGRKVNSSLQIWGLALLFPSIILFFASIGILLFTLISKSKNLDIPMDDNLIKPGDKPLPKDLDINIGIPDFIILWATRILGYGSLLLYVFFSVAGLFLDLPAAFTNQTFLNFLHIVFVASPFLKLLIIVRSSKRTKTLFKQMIKYFMLHVFIASFVTAILMVLDAWGYKIGDLVVENLPSTVFLFTGLNYAIALFLFMTPEFIKKKFQMIIWRLLSIIPLGVMVAFTLIGKSYQIFYGVTRNVFVEVWISNASVALSVISILFIYITFFIKLYFESRYGKRECYLFRNGNLYMLILNVMCSMIIITVGLIDLVFKGSSVFYYLGLGDNIWLFTLIPFILLCKFGPNYSEISRLDEGALS